MSRIRILTLLVIAALTAPAAAPAAPADHPRAKQRPQPASVAYRDAITREGVTLDEYLKARHDLLTAPRAQGGSGLASLPTPRQRVGDEGKNVTLEHEWSEELVSALREEGTDNVLGVAWRGEDLTCFPCLEYLLDNDSQVELRSHDGATGDVEWTLPTPNLAYLGQLDVTGDGTPEILAIEEHLTGTGVGALVAAGQAYTIETRVRVIDAADGSELWATTVDGTYVLAYGWGLVAYAQLSAIEDVPDLIVSAGEADGDDGNDVFLRTVSIDMAYAWAFLAGAVAAPVTMTGRTLGGVDGVERGSVHARSTYVAGCVLLCAGNFAFPALVPIGDVDGDGRADVGVLESVGTGAQLSARSIDDSQTHWSKVYPSLSPDIITYQLDGEGPDDLLLTGSLLRDDIAVDGATGDELWEGSEYPIYWAIPVGDIDDDGGMDFAYDDYIYDPDTDSFSLSLATVSGADGNTIYSEPLSPTTTYEGADGVDIWLCWACDEDLNGDGTVDLLAVQHWYEEVCFPEEEWEYCDWNTLAESTFSIDATDGSIMAEEAPRAPSSESLPFDGDADGDGGADLLALNGPTLSVASGATLTPLWVAQIPVQGNNFYSYVGDAFGADVSSPGGDEVVIGGWDEYYDPETGEYIGYGYRSYVMSASGVVWSV